MLIHITVRHSKDDPTQAALFADGHPLGSVRGQRNAERALRVLKRELEKSGHTVGLTVLDKDPGVWPPMIIERAGPPNRRAGTREHIFGAYDRQGDVVSGTVITTQGVIHGPHITG